MEGSAPESALHLPPGTVLQEKYLIGRALGQGGFGLTYLAYDLNLNMKLAIKEYLPQELAYRTGGQNEVSIYKKSLADNFNYGLEKFLEEARTLARFNEHPNIVSVRDFFKANGTAYLVMNHIEGVTLKEYLAGRDDPLPFEQALDIFMPVLDALKEVHDAGILHRDISPDNLLIDRNGRVVLIDFGAARQAMGDKSRSMSVIMKAGYSPEEQYRSRGEQGPWTDIYAVAATMYHAITGQMPPESLDRLKEDPLALPSTIKVKIETHQEDALLMAMAIQAEDRFQKVEDFQEALLGKKPIGDKKSPEAVKAKADKPGKPQDEHEETKKCPFCSEQIKATAIICKHCKMSLQEDLHEARKRPRKTNKAGHEPLKKQLTIEAVVVLGLILTFYSGSWLFTDGEDDATDPVAPEVEETSQTFDPEVIAGLDADYYIDYTSGIIPISDLPIGARVVDPSWEWEFRTGRDYTFEAGDETKPVTWLVVAKDHYDGLEPHVTLLSEELIGRHIFDNSTNRSHAYAQYGYNHWGESGTGNATRGLRPWLNSSGLHAGEGFYRAFSESFKWAVLTTTVPNKEWQNGSAYTTSDHVFISSNTELGDMDHRFTYPIGAAYAYFQGVDNVKRVARLGGVVRWHWTRSPASHGGNRVRYVTAAGAFYRYYTASLAHYDYYGVRPALNLKSEILVSEINH